MTKEIEVIIFAHARMLRKECDDITVKDVIGITCNCLQQQGASSIMVSVIATAYQARVIAAAGIGYDPRTTRRAKKKK